MDYFCCYDSNDLAVLIMEWTNNNNILSKTFEFHSYLDGIDFVNTVANIAEIENRLTGWQLESFKESYEYKIKNGISLFKKNLIKK